MKSTLLLLLVVSVVAADEFKEVSKDKCNDVMQHLLSVIGNDPELEELEESEISDEMKYEVLNCRTLKDEGDDPDTYIFDFKSVSDDYESICRNTWAHRVSDGSSIKWGPMKDKPMPDCD